MPLIVKDRGVVELRPTPPTVSRMWMPAPPPPRTPDADAQLMQRVLLASRPMSGGARGSWW